MFKTTTFDVETLNQISFERSKLCGRQLNKIAQKEDRAIPLALFEEEFKDDGCMEDDDATDSSSMEDMESFENDEFLKDITNRTSLGLKVSPDPQGSISMSVYDKNGICDDAELQDVLNQTRPLLVKHERKLKDAGLDQVLNTFDPDKIEEKVGGWLRRNHSISEFVPTFRFVQSKRDALREKYACLDSDETLQSDANYFHRFHSRSAARPGHALPSRSTVKRASDVRSVARIPRKVRYTRRGELQYRRKCSVRQWASSCARSHRCLMSKGNSLRKRNVDRIRARRISEDMRPCRRESECVCYYQDKLCKEMRHIADTSTEDWVVEDCETPAKKPLQPKLVQSVPTKARTQCKTVERSLQYVKPASKKTENEYQFADLEQPKKESRKKGAALKKMVTAKTEMTDLDQICSTPKTEVTDLDQKQSINNGVGKSKATAKTEVTDFDQKQSIKNGVGKSKATAKTEVTDFDQKQSIKNGVGKSKAQSKRKYTRRSKKTEMVTSPKESECTFTRELMLAIEISKQTYEMEWKKAESENITNAEVSTKPSICTLEETPILAPENKGPLICKPSYSGSVSSLEDSSKNSSLRPLKPQPRSAKMYKMFKRLVTDDTFFTKSRDICNSTAVKGDKATSRQIMKQNTLTAIRELSEKPTSKRAAKAKSSTKRMPVVSSTKHTSSSAAHSKAISTRSTDSASSDNDSNIVSSSTDPPKPTNTEKGILLYAPHRRHLMPAQSLQGGFFHVTLEHLSDVIGEKVAQKFMKHYPGRLKFASSSTVYYLPTANFNTCAESDSDLDELERFTLYGALYESLNVESQRH